MTIEEYNTATDIIKKLKALDDSIYDIKFLLQQKHIAKWDMEIRLSRTNSPHAIDHKGLLPEFLNMTLSKLREERAEWAKKLEEI